MTNLAFRAHSLYIIDSPAMLRLYDIIFEHLPAEDRVFWPERFNRATVDGSIQSDTMRRISVRILREIALLAVTVDKWGCRDAVIGMVAALKSGDVVRIDAARIAAADAAADAYVDAVYARATAAVRVAYNAGRAAYNADAAGADVVYVAIYAARAAAYADAWQRIADIVCEEMSRAGDVA